MLPSGEQPAPGAQAAGPSAATCRQQGAVRSRLPRCSPKPETPFGSPPRPQLRTRTGSFQKAVMYIAATTSPGPQGRD